MRQVEKLNIQKSGEETISTRSRYCRKCDAQVRWQCKCNPRSAMAWQRRNVFHMGKRYKGKDAWEKVHNTEYKGDSK